MYNFISTIKSYWYNAYPNKHQKSIDGGAFLTGLGISITYLGKESDFTPVSVVGGICGLVGVSIYLCGKADRDIEDSNVELELQDMIDDTKSRGL